MALKIFGLFDWVTLLYALKWGALILLFVSVIGIVVKLVVLGFRWLKEFIQTKSINKKKD